MTSDLKVIPPIASGFTVALVEGKEVLEIGRFNSRDHREHSGRGEVHVKSIVVRSWIFQFQPSG